MKDVIFGGRVYECKFGDASMIGARFNGEVVDSTFWRDSRDGLFPGADLTGAVFAGHVYTLDPKKKTQFYNCDFTNAVFEGNVDNVEFIASTFDHTIFHGDVTRSLFEFAIFTGASFRGPSPMMNNDFFRASGLRSVRFPAGPLDMQSSSFIGTDMSPFAFLASIELSGMGDRIVAAEGKSLEDLARDGELFDALAELLPAGAMKGALPDAWRSVLYDPHALNMKDHGFALQGDEYYELKRFIYDATDDRYTPYDSERPEPAPTLEFMYRMTYLDIHGVSFQPFQQAIDQALLRMLRSNDPEITLDAPYGARAPSYDAADFLVGSGAGRSFDAWIEHVETVRIQYNGVFYMRDQIMFDEEQRSAIAKGLTGDELVAFQALADDGIVSIRDLRAASLDSALELAWQHFGGV